MMKSQSCFPKGGRKGLTTAEWILGPKGDRGSIITNCLNTARKTGVVRSMLSERNKACVYWWRRGSSSVSRVICQARNVWFGQEPAVKEKIPLLLSVKSPFRPRVNLEGDFLNKKYLKTKDHMSLNIETLDFVHHTAKGT